VKKRNIGNATLYLGDSREVLSDIEPETIDSAVVDPPYGLSFMGKAWDYDVPDLSMWRQVFHTLKPGAHLLSFFGSRTYHRGTVAIEDAGFDIRDQIMWVYGSGFPKSHDVSKAIDKAAGAERVVIGSYKATVSARTMTGGNYGGGGSNVEERDRIYQTAPATDAARQWQGWGTALKPAHEPIAVARKPFTGTVAANVIEHGTGALNIDACRVGDDIVGWGGAAGLGYHGGCDPAGGTPRPIAGRYPANFIHEGLTEDWSRFLYCPKASAKDRDEGLVDMPLRARPIMGSGIGGQPDQLAVNSRNVHPTVKPTPLMQYLVRLVTAPGGTVIDPYMGSGSTGKAAMIEGMRFVGIERDPDYFEIACRRIAAAQGLTC
jgi:site-specific DNA-methyltransferase (adenine-specific)